MDIDIKLDKLDRIYKPGVSHLHDAAPAIVKHAKKCGYLRENRADTAAFFSSYIYIGAGKEVN